MYYRITDWQGLPYGIGYNSNNLLGIATALYYNDQRTFEDQRHCFSKKTYPTMIDVLHHFLKNGDRNIMGYYIEESKKPFNEKDLNY